ncbi:hypothetical protein [Halobacillus litoralis]|uniref:hypothetical protein n=1 Tax=Halobacillus litoralis TaxID=45668 RepID=UPI001CD2C6A4|nr:hypothetical protein [Halobacillus litoralis]MCA1021766.1 hypothetical protein [Halobacillus litoralis]
MKTLFNNPSFRMLIVSSMVLTLLVSYLAPIHSQAASQKLTPEELKQAEVLANDLEFLFEEALVIENGKKTFDFTKLKKEYGDEYEDKFGKLESFVNNTNQSNKIDATLVEKENIKLRSSVALASSQSFGDCMVDALKDHFGVAAVTAALEGGLWTYLQKKAYKEAAKLLVKFAVGTNAVGLAGTLIYYGGKCTWQAG